MKAVAGDVASHQTKTFQYRFRPHPNLLPISYRLALDATYRVDGEPHLTTFYNQTINMFEKSTQIDAGLIIQVGLAMHLHCTELIGLIIQASIAVIGAVMGVFALISMFRGKGKSRGRRTTSTSSADWVPSSSKSKQKTT